jgi:hypothetical protein
MKIENPVVTKHYIDAYCLIADKPICRYLSQCEGDGEFIDEYWCGWCTHPLIQEYPIDQFQEMKGHLNFCPRVFINDLTIEDIMEGYRHPIPIHRMPPRQGHGVMFPCK